MEILSNMEHSLRYYYHDVAFVLLGQMSASASLQWLLSMPGLVCWNRSQMSLLPGHVVRWVVCLNAAPVSLVLCPLASLHVLPQLGPALSQAGSDPSVQLWPLSWKIPTPLRSPSCLVELHPFSQRPLARRAQVLHQKKCLSLLFV